MIDARNFNSGIAVLTAKTVSAQSQSALDFDWDCPISLPFWLSRRSAASVITHFLAGELATADMCSRLRDRLDLPAARDFLEAQALDEHRHARIYRLYLDKLGGPDARPPTLYDQAASWQGAPQGIILAFHGVLEGESMRLQQVIDKWLPCPLFREISTVIARDEARHIAFGRLYLRETLPSLPRAERREIFHWLRTLWFEAVRETISNFAPPGFVRPYGGLAGWMANEWEERLADLETLHLFTADERPEFAGTC